MESSFKHSDGLSRFSDKIFVVYRVLLFFEECTGYGLLEGLGEFETCARNYSRVAFGHIAQIINSNKLSLARTFHDPAKTPRACRP